MVFILGAGVFNSKYPYYTRAAGIKRVRRTCRYWVVTQDRYKTQFIINNTLIQLERTWANTPLASLVRQATHLAFGGRVLEVNANLVVYSERSCYGKVLPTTK